MAQTIHKHALGCKPNMPDHRDYDYMQCMAPGIPKALPASVDLRPKCSPVEDQSTVGSCTANALVGNLEFLILKDKRPFLDLSRLFVYYNERVIEQSVPMDNGACLRDGIKTLAKEGCCTELLWPYTESKFAARPTDQCYKDAELRTITQYAGLTSLKAMKTCLADGYPFVFGFTVYSNFYSDSCMKRGRLEMPGPKDTVEGGHAIMAVGYSDASQRLIIRNSWGPKAHVKGYFTMPYAMVSEVGKYSWDFWTVRAGNNL